MIKIPNATPAPAAAALPPPGGGPDQANILLRYDQARFQDLIRAALAAG